MACASLSLFDCIFWGIQMALQKEEKEGVNSRRRQFKNKEQRQGSGKMEEMRSRQRQSVVEIGWGGRIHVVNASFFCIISNEKSSRCAFAGIALTLLLNRCKFHSNFKVWMDPELESGLKINVKSKLAPIQIQTEQPNFIIITWKTCAKSWRIWTK